MRQYSGFDNLPEGTASTEVTPGCLVLEGGAFRGVYTSGVLDALMEAGINLQTVIGVSAGALNGVSYVSGQIGRAARINLGHRHDHEYIGPKTILSDQGVIGFKYVLKDSMVEFPFELERFKNPERRFVAVATELETGKAHYFEKGKCRNIFRAVKASASMQYVSAPVMVDDVLCLDGGPGDYVPFQWAIDEGYERVVVIRTRDLEFRCEPKEQKIADTIYRKYPEYAEVLKTTDFRYNELCEEMQELQGEDRIFVIAPSEPVTVGRLESDMEKLGELYYLGYEDGKRAIPELLEYFCRHPENENAGKHEEKNSGKLIEKKFEELSATELYEILKARAAIFVVEQSCVYQDLDDEDYDSIHFYYADKNGKVTAYIRAFEMHDEPGVFKAGRVLTMKHGEGLGGKILSEVIKSLKKNDAVKEIRIDAQTYAVGFYAREGFKVESEEFMEDGIPHVTMRLRIRGEADEV